MVCVGGLEPPASRTQTERSTRLNYTQNVSFLDLQSRESNPTLDRIELSYLLWITYIQMDAHVGNAPTSTGSKPVAFASMLMGNKILHSHLTFEWKMRAPLQANLLLSQGCTF